MPMNTIPLFFDESSKKINMISVVDQMQLAMHKTAPDIKSSVEKYQSSVQVQFEVGRVLDNCPDLSRS